MTKRVIVTGGSGLAGKWVVEESGEKISSSKGGLSKRVNSHFRAVAAREDSIRPAPAPNTVPCGCPQRAQPDRAGR